MTLPPLPETKRTHQEYDGTPTYNLYTAEQMTAYGQQCYRAGRDSAREDDSLSILYKLAYDKGRDSMLKRLHEETESLWMDAKRLAMELECLLLSCELPAVSKWWDSANEALELHRQLVRDGQET